MGAADGVGLVGLLVVSAARAFRKGMLAMRVRERLADVFVDKPFAPAFGARGTGLSPGMLALVRVLQFAENLTDRQAAEMAARAIGWKYALPNTFIGPAPGRTGRYSCPDRST